MLWCGDEFKSYEDLISAFQQAEFVQLYIRHLRTIELASATWEPKKKFNEDLVFSEIDFACHHGGKDYKTASTRKAGQTRSVILWCDFVL